ncbi:MAG TPA: response regulator transcription factor [Armatimonadota bacterium]|nr:response regulator transcription factor [Armatimonadota bacterium]
MRVMLVDDHRLVREGLRALLEEHDDITVVAQADNGRIAVQLCPEVTPDIVLMDVAMPELNGIEATRQITEDCPSTKVIALSMHSNPRFVTQLLQAGIFGYILKDADATELRQAIDTVMMNRPYFCPQISKIILEDYLGRKSMKIAGLTPFELLTARECEVLQLLAEGKSTREAAEILFVSVKTIEKHRQQLMERLDIHSIAELTRYAIREGVIPLDF